MGDYSSVDIVGLLSDNQIVAISTPQEWDGLRPGILRRIILDREGQKKLLEWFAKNQPALYAEAKEVKS